MLWEILRSVGSFVLEWRKPKEARLLRMQEQLAPIIPKLWERAIDLKRRCELLVLPNPVKSADATDLREAGEAIISLRAESDKCPDPQLREMIEGICWVALDAKCVVLRCRTDLNLPPGKEPELLAIAHDIIEVEMRFLLEELLSAFDERQGFKKPWWERLLRRWRLRGLRRRVRGLRKWKSSII
jgi:hypothetical protein